MVGPIEFWFDFSSPYAYFASVEVEARLACFGRAIHWRPFLLGAAFQTTGMEPLSRMPIRGDYARRDWLRIAIMLDVPFTLRADHPMPSQTIARAFYWFVGHHPDRAEAFAKAAFASYFGRGEDLRDVGAVLGLARAFTDEHQALQYWLGCGEARDILRQWTDEALSKGVFGSPFFFVDGEPFWGWDRLWMIEAWLANSRWRGSCKVGGMRVAPTVCDPMGPRPATIAENKGDSPRGRTVHELDRG